MGWENVFSVEVDPFCLTVLDHHFQTPKSMATSTILAALSTKGKSTSSQVDSPANPFQRQGKRQAPQTTDIYGPKCSALFAKLAPDGSWRKTFADSLIGLKGWSSTRVR